MATQKATYQDLIKEIGLGYTFIDVGQWYVHSPSPLNFFRYNGFQVSGSSPDPRSEEGIHTRVHRYKQDDLRLRGREVVVLRQQGYRQIRRSNYFR